mgnify:CR=1 FL=1
MEALGIEPTDTPPSVTNLSQEEIAELFDKVDRRYCREEENLSKLLEHQAGLISQSRTLGGFPFQSLKLETVRNLSQLCIEAGVLRSDAIIRARQTLVDDAILVPSAQNPGEMLVGCPPGCPAAGAGGRASRKPHSPNGEGRIFPVPRSWRAGAC